jgi:hypothetical protein
MHGDRQDVAGDHSRKARSVKKLKSIDDITSKKASGNMGTARGQELLEESLAQHGIGRGIVVDKNGVVIAGEKLLEALKAAGIEKIKVVRTKGDKLVAVQRTDLDLAADQSAKELAVLDNRTAELNLFWDESLLQAVAGEHGIDALGFTKALGLSTKSEQWQSKAVADRKSAATLNIGGVYVLKVPHEPFTTWQNRLHDDHGYEEDTLVEELKRRLRIP